MSKTLQELAPHIDEINRALKDEIESHEIETELDTFVNTYGISLPEAKRAVIRKLGGSPQLLSPRRTYQVSGLQNGLFRVDINGRIVNLTERTYERDGEQRTLFSGIIADETGKIEFTAWDDFGLKEGNAYKFSNCYTKPWRGRVQLNLGKNTQVEAIQDETIPPMENVMQDALHTVDRLTLLGGSPGARVEGFVVGVRHGSGLVFRCPECNRVVLKKNCITHGTVDVIPDLRIKGIFDDGYGALYFIAPREITEQVIGIDLDECKRIASERMDARAIQDIIEQNIIGMFCSMSGDVFTDDYGTTMLVQSLEPVDRDLKNEAAELLEALEG